MKELREIKKVLLLNPPSIVKQSWVEEMAAFPLGLAYMASILERENFVVEIIDCFMEGYFNRKKLNNGLLRIGLSEKKIIAIISRYQPELVGISISFSCQLSSALDLNATIKQIDLDIVTVAGGNHVSAAPQSLRKGNFDRIISGEGEYRLLNLIKDLNYRKARLPKVDDKDDYINDLDSLPFPQYDLLPLKKYWRTNRFRRWFNVIATRGCPYRCYFCSIHTIMGRKIRYRSIQNVLDELILLKQKYNAEQIYFEDDNLTFNMNWAKELFTEIIKADLALEIFLRNGIRADRVDLELLKLMKEAGLKKVWFSPESGSQKTLDKILKKNLKLEDCENAIKMAKKAGLHVTCFLIIGFPEETRMDVEQTLAYADKLKSIGADYIWLSCATPYPGTEFFAECIQKGILAPDNIDYQSLSTMDSVIHNEWFSAAEIKRIRDQAMVDLNKRGFSKHLESIQKAIKLLFSNPGVLTRILFWRMVKILRIKVQGMNYKNY